MRFRRAALLLLTGWSLWCADSSLEPSILLLAKARREILDNLARVPKVTCLATIDRSKGTALELEGPWHFQDRARMEVALIGRHELFAWPGEDHFHSQNPLSLIGHGAGGTGEFAVHLHNVFDSSANVHASGAEPLESRPAIHYYYQLASVLGRYEVVYAGHIAYSTASGMFWLDAKTGELLRLDTYENDLPEGFPIVQAIVRTTYGRVLLHNVPFLLPARSEMIIVERTGRAYRNVTQYTHCREFTTESRLFFPIDGAESAAPARAADLPSPTREASLPGGLKLTMRLETPLDEDKNGVGDALSAVLTEDAVHHGKVLLPRGTQITGRLRRMERSKQAEQSCVLGLEFTEVLWEGRRTRFFGRLERLQNSPKLSLLASRDELQAFPSLAGVAPIYGRPGECRLPAGSQLEWRTLTAPQGP